MVITDECINCAACVEECEHNAIYETGAPYSVNGEEKAAISSDHFYIATELCDECKSCVEVCPVDSIIEAPIEA